MPELQDRPLPSVDRLTLERLDFGRIREAVAARAQTEVGRARAQALPLLPSEEAVRTRLATVHELMTLVVEDRSWPSLAGITDLADTLRLAEKQGVLEPLQLRAVANAFAVGESAANWVLGRRARAPRLAEVVDAFGDYASLVARLERSIEPTGRISDDASPALRDLRKTLNGLRESLRQRMEKLVAELDAQGLLQDTFHTLREDRYVLPVKANERWRVEGIVHDTSQTHQTFFIEPQEVVDLGNRMKMADADVQQEELRILRALSHDVGARAREMAQDLEALHRLDVVVASARLGTDLGGHVPQVVPAGGDTGAHALDVRVFRHPVLLLDALQRGEKPRVVPNHLHVGRTPVLVLTGPNTGGKTVALKGAGLCAVMARAGLPIPASPDSVVPLYPRVHAVVGDGQSLHEGLSSFGAHLQSVRQMVEAVARSHDEDHGVLCLLDEVMSGTDPEQGAALAQAVMEHLANHGAHVVATTHFERLKALPLSPEGARTFRNASVGLGSDGASPTYTLTYDTPGSSSALAMAARLGLPHALVDRARELTGAQAQKLDDLVRGLSASHAALEEERAAVARAHEDARAVEASLRESREAFRAEQDEWRKKARKGLLDEFMEARRAVEEALERARKESAAGAVEAARAALAEAQAQEARVAEQVARDERDRAVRDAPSGPIQVGSRVHVITLGVLGEVLERTEKDALVAAGPLRVRVALSDVVPARKKAEPGTSRPAPAARENDGPAARASLDLRGQRVEDALEALGAFIDQGVLRGASTLTVVHGHGTGALRTAIRQALRGHPSVASSQPGGQGAGGNGATLITLKDA